MNNWIWKNQNLLTGTYIGVGFERKLLLLPVYVLRPINFNPTLYLYDPDEPYAAFISKTSLVRVFSLMKY